MTISVPQRHVEQWQQTIARYHDLLAAQPHDVRILTNLAWSYERAGQYAQAVEHFQKAVRLDPNNADAQYGLGLALLASGQRNEAVQALERAYSLAGESELRGYMVIVQHHCQVLFRTNRDA